jgi:transketolase
MRKTSLECIYQMAKKDNRIVFIGSDLGAGVLSDFRKEMQDRFFMEGVSEANIIGMAAGFALEGKIVYVSTIATFITRRCFEQNVLDLGLHNLKVRLIGVGGGLVYAPLGPTHLAIDDIAIMRTIPNMTIVAPCDAQEMKRLMYQTVDYPGPMYIRVAKGGEQIVSSDKISFKIGRAISMRKGSDALIITTGITLKLALDAAKELEKNKLKIGILHLHTIKPLDKKTILSEIKKVPFVVSIEEHSIIGALGSCIAEILTETNFRKLKKRFVRIALPDEFPKGYGSQESMMKRYGISVEHLVKELRKNIK